MVDTRFYRSVGKKFPLLNLSLFTKKNPDGEFQGQSMLGKFSTHEYRCTDKSYEANIDSSSAQQLQNAIFRFFDHYRSISAILQSLIQSLIFSKHLSKKSGL